MSNRKNYNFKTIEGHYFDLKKSSNAQHVKEFLQNTDPDLTRAVLLHKTEGYEQTLLEYITSYKWPHQCLVKLIETAEKLGIANAFLLPRPYPNFGIILQFLMQKESSASNHTDVASSPDAAHQQAHLSFSYYLDACERNQLDMKGLLTAAPRGTSQISHAIRCNLNSDSFKMLLDYFERHLPSEEVVATFRQRWAGSGVFAALAHFSPRKRFIVNDQVLMCMKFCGRKFSPCSELDDLICHGGEFLLPKLSSSDNKQQEEEDISICQVIVMIAYISSLSKWRQAVADAKEKGVIYGKQDKATQDQHFKLCKIRFRDFFGHWPETPRIHAKNAEDVGGSSSSCCSVQ